MKYPIYIPQLHGNEKQYVNECLDTSWISALGSFISKFEGEFAKYTGVNHAISVCNGTVALHLALLALGIQEGDEVIVPTFTYIASVNAIKYVNATPVFVDCTETDWQIDVNEVERKITPKTKAIMAVHLYGCPCDIDELMALAKQHNLKVIEDCAEAIGTQYNHKMVGSFGDVATFSFYGNKTITTGEGGMVVTNDENIAKFVRKHKGQGLAENREYWHDVLGYNYRMTNICAAIGLAQLEQVNTFLANKVKIKQWYEECLQGLPVTLHQASNAKKLHTYWMYSILLDDPLKVPPLRAYLKENGIETRPLFPNIHQMPVYETGEHFPVSEKIAALGMNLPSYPSLERDDIAYICNKIKEGLLH